MENISSKDIGELINIGAGKDCTILELVETIKEVVGYKDKSVFDTSKPDSSPRKLLDVSNISPLDWKAKTTLKMVIRKMYQDFLSNHNFRK
jgi:GDP-L-fucose synthase